MQYKNVKGNYLVCTRCDGYYELREGESPYDFESCQCGGGLILVHDIDELTEGNSQLSYKNKNYSSNKRKFLKKSNLFLVSIIVIVPLILFNTSLLSSIVPDSLMQDNPIIGSDNRGFVIKETYSHGANGPKIAVVTGMHPREISAKNVVPEVLKDYALKHNAVIVNYQINVINQPDNYKIGRSNGEGLVAQYVIPDIAKSNYKLVIIAHNHRQGYGSGYYIATPTMDNESVDLAKKVHSILPSFNYYQRNVDEDPEQTSINGVDKPIVNSGTPVFVYEIPEWLGNSDVNSNTNRLIDAVFKVV
ncbi:MAG: hypothetical protein ACXVHU_09480 [Methanobacterium sp.]